MEERIVGKTENEGMMEGGKVKRYWWGVQGGVEVKEYKYTSSGAMKFVMYCGLRDKCSDYYSGHRGQIKNK